MRMLADNKEAGIQLYLNGSQSALKFTVVCDTGDRAFESLKRAFDFYDKEVARTMTTPALDLEAVSYPFKCQTDDGRIATVIAERRTEVNDATYIVIIDHANSKDFWSNDELLFLSDRVGHLYFADGDDQTGNHLIPIQPPKPLVRTG